MIQRLTRFTTRSALLVFSVVASTASTNHVSKGGDDSQDGLRRESAFATIQRGVDALEPGDTLLVGPGVYREQVAVEKSGTKAKPITIRAEIAGLTELVGSRRITNWTSVPARKQVLADWRSSRDAVLLATTRVSITNPVPNRSRGSAPDRRQIRFQNGALLKTG